MLTVSKPLNVKLIVAFIYSCEKNYLLTKNILIKKFKSIDFESEPLPFNYTTYYNPEMGPNLTRRFISFVKLIDPSKISSIKEFCIKIEKKFARSNKRTVNIDPGYINEAKFVLATTKDFSHRIYLGKGIYAEVTLNYQNKDFQDLPTTFPDYRTAAYKEILKKIRNIYRTEIGR
jgi:hypothetical protein